MNDEDNVLFTNQAWNLLEKIVVARYQEAKIADYVDFDPDIVDDLAVQTVESAMQELYKKALQK